MRLRNRKIKAYRAPRFSNLSFKVMALATVTPSEEVRSMSIQGGKVHVKREKKTLHYPVLEANARVERKMKRRGPSTCIKAQAKERLTFGDFGTTVRLFDDNVPAYARHVSVSRHGGSK
jgi:hypothetical protein